MKVRLFSVLIVLVLALALVTPVFAQGEEPPVPPVLPDPLVALISLAIVFLVTLGLKSLSNLFGKDLTGWAAGIAAGLTSAIVFFLNGLLSLVPPAWYPIVTAFLGFLVILLGSMGLFKLVKAFSPNPSALSGRMLLYSQKQSPPRAG